jgi:hypothetical protein
MRTVARWATFVVLSCGSTVLADDLCTRLASQLHLVIQQDAVVGDRALSTLAAMERAFPESSLEAVDAVLKHADQTSRVAAADQLLARLSAEQANTVFTRAAQLSEEAQSGICRISLADPFITEPGRSLHDLLSVNLFTVEEKQEMIRQLTALLDDANVLGAERMVHKAGNTAVGVNRGGQVELRLNDRIRSGQYSDLGSLEEVDFDLSGDGSDPFRLPDGTQAVKIDTRTSTHAISSKSKTDLTKMLSLTSDVPDADITRLIVESHFLGRQPILVANVPLDPVSAARLAAVNSDEIYIKARTAIQSLGGDPTMVTPVLFKLVGETP